MNLLGALNYAAEMLAYELHEHCACRQDMLNFLDERARNSSASDKLAVVVMDNASIQYHIDPCTLQKWMVCDRFMLLPLPPYSLVFNYIENLLIETLYHVRTFATRITPHLLHEVHTLFRSFDTKFKFNCA